MAPKRMTAAAVARDIDRVLETVERTGRRVHITRRGRVVAELVPASARTETVTWGELQRALARVPPPDEDFLADVLAIRREAGAAGGDPWARSSTPQS